MRCFIDSNVIISAGLFPNSVPAAAMRKAFSAHNTAIVCDYSLDEVHRVINKKFPNRVSELEVFLYRTLFSVELVSTPTDSVEDESGIRDADDQPILRAAISSNADVIITGDKDLLESGVVNPQVITPSQFLNMSDDKPSLQGKFKDMGIDIESGDV